MKPIFLPDSVRSAKMRGPSNGELIGGTLVIVDPNSLDENTERNFCLNHFLGDLSLFEDVVDMARSSVIDGTCKLKAVYICLYNHHR